MSLGGLAADLLKSGVDAAMSGVDRVTTALTTSGVMNLQPGTFGPGGEEAAPGVGGGGAAGGTTPASSIDDLPLLAAFEAYRSEEGNELRMKLEDKCVVFEGQPVEPAHEMNVEQDTEHVEGFKCVPLGFPDGTWVECAVQREVDDNDEFVDGGRVQYVVRREGDTLGESGFKTVAKARILRIGAGGNGNPEQLHKGVLTLSAPGGGDGELVDDVSVEHYSGRLAGAGNGDDPVDDVIALKGWHGVDGDGPSSEKPELSAALLSLLLGVVPDEYYGVDVGHLPFRDSGDGDLSEGAMGYLPLHGIPEPEAWPDTLCDLIVPDDGGGSEGGSEGGSSTPSGDRPDVSVVAVIDSGGASKEVRMLPLGRLSSVPGGGSTCVPGNFEPVFSVPSGGTGKVLTSVGEGYYPVGRRFYSDVSVDSSANIATGYIWLEVTYPSATSSSASASSDPSATVKGGASFPSSSAVTGTTSWMPLYKIASGALEIDFRSAMSLTLREL